MSGRSLVRRIEWILIVLVITVLEVGPVPFMGLICLYVLIFRPRWFKTLIDQIYAD